MTNVAAHWNKFCVTESAVIMQPRHTEYVSLATTIGNHPKII